MFNKRDEQQASAYLAAIVDSSDDVIVSKNLNGIITSWNRSAERIFGYTPEEAIGQHISLIIPQDKLDEEVTIISKIKAGIKVDHFETVRRRKDGSLVNLSITVSPIRDQSGNIIGASKVARDITERIKTEQALIEASRKKDEFLAGVSHELRTPMNAIIGLAHILARSENLSPKGREYLETLSQSAENLMALINDLLDMSKFEAGGFELEEIEFSLPETIEKTVRTLRLNAARKNIALDVVYIQPVRKDYIGDPLRIQQMLTNLIGNAIKFTEKGSVTLKISATENNGKSELSFSVIDTGIGIPQNKINSIFDKFVQADTSITRKYGGSGLGLTITKELAEKMGGHISVQSQEGIGTTFTVTVILENGKNDAVVQESNLLGPVSKKNVLVVEDYEPNVIVATAMLDLLDYSYDVASNGAQAVRRYSENKYDVILMDIQMEGMDGFESTQRIRDFEQENKLAQTPILAMTAHVTEKDKNRCLQLGMNDFIPKPFSPDQLKEKLSVFIESSKAA